MIFRFGDTVTVNHDVSKAWPSYTPFERLKVISISKHCLAAASDNGNTFIGSAGCFELVARAEKSLGDDICK